MSHDTGVHLSPMIKNLKNPKTNNYLTLKDIALSYNLPLQWMCSGTGMPYYCHTLITRPEGPHYSSAVSTYTELFVAVITEILNANNLAEKGFHIIRGTINVVHPSEGEQFSEPHIDHIFPHVNLITYLTNVGGRTFCEKEEHDPQEDDVILFKGEHYMERPKKDRRVVLVSTIYLYN